MAEAALTLPVLLDTWTVVPVARALVLLGVADAVSDTGAVSLEELAAATGADPAVLYRAIRFVSGFGVFEEQPGRLVAHTETSRDLRQGGALRTKLVHRAAMEMVSPYVDGFEAALRDGSKSAFEHLHSEDYFTQWLPRHPESEALFGQFMLDRSSAALPFFVEAYPWPAEGIVADVGGGMGHFLRAILAATPQSRGVLFDLPSTVATAQGQWPEGDVMRSDRVTYCAGNFFSAVPVVADVYVLKWVLHDWSDDKCVLLLSNLRKSATTNSAVVVIDMLVPEELNRHHLSKFFDIHMAAGYGGRERTELELREIAEKAGWQPQPARPIAGTPFSCLELRAA